MVSDAVRGSEGQGTRDGNHYYMIYASPSLTLLFETHCVCSKIAIKMHMEATMCPSWLRPC
jgi:hypothetical protein